MTSIAAIRTRLTQLVNTKQSVTSRFEPLVDKTIELQRLAEQISERIETVRTRLQQSSDKHKYYGMLKSDLDKAARIFDQFREVFRQWEAVRAESAASVSAMLQQIMMFSEELVHAKEDLNKMMAVGPSFSDAEANRKTRRMATDAALLVTTMNEVKESNANWILQREGAAGELSKEIDRLRIAHTKLIDNAERYVESYRAVRCHVLDNWNHDVTLNFIEK